ncbi:MAG: hypothetical protein EHM28_07490, partial [Spirochaetaceae bacterium]
MVSPESVINKNLENDHVTFVFPSETVAEAMLHKIAAKSARRVIPKDRFVSWDRFKEMTFRYPQNASAVNNFYRSLFCAGLLAENSRRSFLFSLILPEHARESLNALSYFKNNLPLLARIRENYLSSQSSAPFINRMKLADLLLLNGRYHDFLDGLSLYEPDSEVPVFQPQDAGECITEKTESKEYYIFYPEVISDFKPVTSMLSSDKSVHLYLAQEMQKIDGRIMVFENSIQELRWLVTRIDKALDEGVDPADIAITIAGHESYLTFLETEAMLHDIPLQIKIGKPILSYPGVNLFEHMQHVVDYMFGVRDLQILFSNRSIPWKKSELLLKLVEFGFAHNCIQNYQYGNMRKDIWDSHLDRLKNNDNKQEYPYAELQDLYHSLRRHLTAVVQAVSFRSLKDAVHACCTEMIDMSGFGEWEQKYFQFALSILDETVLYANRVSLDQDIKPFSIWLSILREKTYVKPAAKRGITVYAYKVSAGIMPRLHFIVNASHTGTTVVSRAFPFMTSKEESMMPDTVNDYSEAIINLYEHSGEQVYFSYSRKGFDDTHLAPQTFIRRGNVIEAAGQSEVEELSRGLAERRIWASGKPDMKGGITSIQRDGFKAAIVTALAGKKNDFTKKTIGETRITEIINSVLRDESGMLHINATGLGLFLTCRFKYFMERVIVPAEMSLESDFQNDIEYGNIIHHVFEIFYQGLINNKEVFHGRNKEHYKEIFSACISVAAAYWEMRKSLPPFPIWEIWKNQLHAGFTAFCELESMRHEKYTVEGVEEKLQYQIPGRDVLADGKIDLMIHDEDGLCIVDYKKKKVPGRESAENIRKNPQSLQMPFYLFLAENNRLDVHTASFYSFFEIKYHDFIMKEAKNPEEQQLWLEKWFTALE